LSCSDTITLKNAEHGLLSKYAFLQPDSITDKILLCEAAVSMGIQSADFFQVKLVYI
jgi:hypothetical protein